MINITLKKPNNAAIDIPHGMLILGALMSAKPKNILEIGIGTGFITNLLLDGIEYNQLGILTSVDNYHDLGGNLPNLVLDSLKLRHNINIVAPIEERDFISQCHSNQFDFLVSDGDHNNADQWADKVFDIIKPDCFMFFHDVSNSGYPNLKKYQTRAIELNKPNYLFNYSSRGDEECERGILMVINKK